MSIQKRDTPAGTRYVARYRGPDKKERSKTFERRKDAKLFLAETERAVNRREWIEPANQKLTLGELMDDHRKRATNSRTRQVRKFAADNLGEIADVPLAELRPSTVRGHLAWLHGNRGLSPASAKRILATIKAALNTAVNDGLLLKSPAATVSPPRVDAEVVTASTVLTSGEVKRICEAAPPVEAVAVMLATATGLRISEIAGLKVS